MNSTPITVAVVGATGFVGRHVVEHLATAGHRVFAISREGTRRPNWADSVETRRADVATGRGLTAALEGAEAAVHLVAIPRESKGRTFQEINVRGAERVVEAARTTGIRRIVHLSAMGVTDDPKLAFLSSKWRGEQAIRDGGLEWVVLRPSLLFGPGDGFFNLVKVTLKWWSPGIVAIPGKGDARFQPLAVDDLAIGVERSLTDPGLAGAVLELGGPDWWTYREIVDEVMRVTGMKRLRLGLPIPFLSVLTSVTDRVIPIFPVSHDQISSLQRPNSTEIDAFERAFGVKPRRLDLSYLR